jgi:hypothetical protein
MHTVPNLWPQFKEVHASIVPSGLGIPTGSWQMGHSSGGGGAGFVLVMEALDLADLKEIKSPLQRWVVESVSGAAYSIDEVSSAPSSCNWARRRDLGNTFLINWMGLLNVRALTLSSRDMFGAWACTSDDGCLSEQI